MQLTQLLDSCFESALQLLSVKTKLFSDPRIEGPLMLAPLLLHPLLKALAKVLHALVLDSQLLDDLVGSLNICAQHSDFPKNVSSLALFEISEFHFNSAFVVHKVVSVLV